MATMVSSGTGDVVGASDGWIDPDEMDWLQLVFFRDVSIKLYRHVGQDEWEVSHLSIQQT